MDYRIVRAFNEEEADASEMETAEAPEYAFEGFTIELNEKIALTPITANNKL